MSSLGYHMKFIITAAAVMAVFVLLCYHVNPWLGWAFLLGTVLVLIRRSKNRCKAERSSYWAAKTPITDDEFLVGLPIASEQQRRFCLAIRGKVAEEAQVAGNLIYPFDRMIDYVDMGYQEPHSMSGVRVIEDDLGLGADENFVANQEIEGLGPVLGGETLGDYMHFYLTNWDRITGEVEVK